MDANRKEAIMASQYRIGELEFDTEEEYLATKADLERIKEIMASFNVKTPEGAGEALDTLGEDGGFSSDYGRKFMEKLRRTSGASAGGASKAGNTEKKKPTGNPSRTSGGRGKGSQTQSGKSGNATGNSSVHIITKRNIIIVAVALILVCGIVGALKLSGKLGAKKTGSDSEMRNLVMGYAANQVSLKSDLYNYYLNVQGESETVAKQLADTDISTAYAMDVTVLNLEKISDEYLEQIYTALVTAGDIENGAYNEPAAVTELKEKIALAGAVGSGESASGGNSDITYDEPENTEDALKVNLINQLMDYEQRVATALKYEYSQFDMEEDEVNEYVIEDMEQMFDTVLYDMTLTDEEKIMYFDTLSARGLFVGGKLARYSSSPSDNELPDLTPSVNLVIGGNKTKVTCIQESVAPVYSVAYRLTDGEKEGYLMFRGNENMSVVLNDDSGNGTFMQGDVLLKWNGKVTIGEWYYNAGKIGFAIGDELGDGVEYIYELVY